MKKNKTDELNKRICFLSALLCVILCAGLLSGCGKSGDEEESTGTLADENETEMNDNAIITTVEWNGKTYKYNSDLINILFLGIDNTDLISAEDIVPGASGQSDCIILLSLNTETEQATILQINRNTMTSIDIYEIGGSYSRSITAQLCLQYAYCTGGAKSCRAVVTTVSELLYGLDIDGYFALDIEGLPEINDALGGVYVTCSYDYTYLDESYTEGATVYLEGEAAQKFVQYRDITEFNSVEGRMYRQVDYVSALLTTMDSSSGSDLYELLSPYLDTYVVTDLTAEELKAMKNYEYLTDSVLYLPGETTEGEEYEEYYVDEEELQNLIIETFYVEVED